MTAPPSTTTPPDRAGADRAHPFARERTGHSHPLTAGPARPRPRAARPGRDSRADGGHDFDLPALPGAVDVFDTTLRDGSQQEGLSLTVDDKLRVAEQLDRARA